MAAAKVWVEDEWVDAAKLNALEARIVDRVEKQTPGFSLAVYTVDSDNVQATKQLTSSATANTAMYRGTGGVTAIGTPDGSSASAAVNVAYVNARHQAKFMTGTTAGSGTTRTVTLDAPNATYTPVSGDFFLLTFPTAISSSNTTVAINGGAALNLRTPGGSTSSGNIIIEAGAAVLVYLDGTFLRMVASQNHALSTMTTAEIDTGTSTSARNITPALVAYIMRDQRIGTAALTGTSSPNADVHNQFNYAGITAGVGVGAATGTPVDGQILVIRFRDNGTARAITWNAIYRSFTNATLPTTTVAGKTTYVTLRYNTADAKWDALDVKTEA